MNCAVILAAGSGTRMGGEEPKVLRCIAGNTVLWHAVTAFDYARNVASIVLVVPKGQVLEYTEMISEFNISKSIDIVEGADTRMESSLNGLKAVPKDCDIVAVHDAARITIDPQTIDDALDFANEHGSALVSGPVFDTIKQVKDGRVVKTVDRSRLMAAYTPQIFKYKELMAALLDALSEKRSYTDEASVMENAGYNVYIYDIGRREIKLTVEEDVYILEALKSKGVPLVGTGTDTHRLVEERKFILGGVHIPYEKGLLGHSDADVLTHAIMDALLGGAGMRDIGYHFPDTDAKYKDADSISLLKEVSTMLKKNSIDIKNIDATVICQDPKIMPYGAQMSQNIADALGIAPSCVNIKATTTEGIGEHGNGKAVSAVAVCSLVKRN
jgi:2-C-methyl-D-erythritol 4-phosphate cytidylyltransferase/2-C-methyl-D-erythritol 2,4-cyclodiphosphate synthase